MEEEHQHHLIACGDVSRNSKDYDFSLPKRKRKNSFRIMEIEETFRPIRGTHDIITNEPRRAIEKDLNQQAEIISSVMERAERVQKKLKRQFPSFVKPMIRSNITGGFWLLFCELHLPRYDINITLVDESYKEYYTKYLPERRGLSAGWQGFSISHSLEEGDVLVFHLVGLWKMKVYIVRAKCFSEVDAALSLVHLQADAQVVVDHSELRRCCI